MELGSLRWLFGKVSASDIVGAVHSVIVMDNATFHKGIDIQKIIEDSGHTILWLPPYTPDLNPIEQTWAWVKKKRQDWGIDCIDTLFFYFLWLCDCF